MTRRITSADSVIGNVSGFVDPKPLFLFPRKGLFFRFTHDSWEREWVHANGRKRYANDWDKENADISVGSCADFERKRTLNVQPT